MSDFLTSLMRGLQGALGMDATTFSMIVRVGAGLLMVFSFVMLVIAVRVMRRPARARWFAPLLGLATSVGVSALYLLLLQPPVNPGLALWLLALGGVLGVLQGWQTKLYWENQTLMARRTGLYMALFGVAYLLTLGLGQLQNAALHAVGVLTMMLSVGVAVGSNVNLALQQGWMRVRGPR